MTGKGRKITSLTIKQKLEIINLVNQDKISKNEVAKEYNCDISTIHRILRNQKEVELSVTRNNLKRKRLRQSSCNKVENALLQWFDQMRATDAAISNAQILQKAKEFAIKMNCDFEPSSGWLWRWQRRENIQYKKLQGEIVDAYHAQAGTFRDSLLKDILKDYEPCNIFNADESGLFYKALPNVTFCKEGGKTQKDHLTLLFLCNADGTFKKVFVIGKPRNSRCFNEKDPPVPYYSQNKAWMTVSLWSMIMKEFDREMGKQKRKVLLIVDNASCHKVNGLCLENVKIEFLPSNTTSVLQPLEQGVIHCFKFYFRKILIRKLILSTEKGESIKEFLNSISILNVLTYIKRSWWLVTSETIKNCFRKAGFPCDGNRFDCIEEVCDTIDIPMEIEEFQEYVACDNNVNCFGTLTDDEIVECVLSEDNEVCQSSEECPTIDLGPPSFAEAINALSIVEKFMECNNIEGDDVDLLEEKLFKRRFKNFHQSNFTTFFN